MIKKNCTPTCAQNHIRKRVNGKEKEKPRLQGGKIKNTKMRRGRTKKDWHSDGKENHSSQR